MFNTVTKAQMQELIEYIASKMSVIDVSTIADANNVEEGYFNETDNKFYKEADYTTEITGKNKTIYISLNTDLPYYFNGTSFVALSSPQQNSLDAGDGIDISNDTISIDEMPAEDMSEIIPQLPPIRNNRMKYSTEEQIVGEWIDGKPIYQKTFDNDITISQSTWQTLIDVSSLNIDKLLFSDVIGLYNEEKYGSLVDLNVIQIGLDYPSKSTIKYYPCRTWTRTTTVNFIVLQYTKTTD